MISAFSRDGWASMSLTCKRSSTPRVLTHTTRPLSYSVVLNHRVYRHGPQYRLSPCSAYFERQYSTSIPPAEKAAASSEDLPPAGARTKKLKVELRPAPVRPQSIAAAAASSNASTSTPAAQDAPGSSPAAPSSATHGQEGLIDVAKHDVEDAAQHGILKPPPENANRFMKLFHQAKELFKFYVRGLKLINTNRKRANAMRERVKNGGPPLTRWETRFIRTYQEDALKLIPFALIIIIAEEVIPLVVMYAPSILPSTCILPSQKERIDTKKRDKRAAYASEMTQVFEAIRQRGQTDLSADARVLLSGSGVTAVGGLLGHSAYGFEAMRLRKILRHLQQVTEDDALLLKEDMGRGLSSAETREALDERGMYVNC
ncbi:hypothetical protein PHLGIDRAFT_35050 [Phlebiopsis gigantea 11061_1 CR5-6]|uniref:Letm1 RBD domain-containing protein n=1 Tax=Phlebiopsis gigantea (strain 11061_1 CR5-6) TaxID=745531 RepID=A0A0C3PNC2_PHLG1|nr:hypothetical protein PHLGIDRAFT_35050 [Phlebiopsis gigantea 11061_1 CR5-6]